MFKQLIIARRDLNMSPGKLAAQVSHASIAFLLEKLYWGSKEVDGHIGISLDRDLFHNWIKQFVERRMWRSDAINIKLEDGYNLIFSFEATDDQSKQKIILYII